jgi:hypothetical protein
MDLVYSEEERMKKEGEKEKLSLISVAQMATDKYHILVSKSTLSTLKSKGIKTILMQGRKGEVSDEELDDVAEALVSYIAISQINGDAEVHTSDAIQILAKIYKDTHSERSLRCIWERIKKRFPHMLNMDKELLVELRRQMWTTFDNLNEWFDAWKAFCIDCGFALNDGPPEGFEGEIYFSEEQKRRILNLDETFCSFIGWQLWVGTAC